jgi:hypothetical protein
LVNKGRSGGQGRTRSKKVGIATTIVSFFLRVSEGRLASSGTPWKDCHPKQNRSIVRLVSPIALAATQVVVSFGRRFVRAAILLGRRRESLLSIDGFSRRWITLGQVISPAGAAVISRRPG